MTLLAGEFTTRHIIRRQHIPLSECHIVNTRCGDGSSASLNICTYSCVKFVCLYGCGSGSVHTTRFFRKQACSQRRTMYVYDGDEVASLFRFYVGFCILRTKCEPFCLYIFLLVSFRIQLLQIRASIQFVVRRVEWC